MSVGHLLYIGCFVLQIPTQAVRTRWKFQLNWSTNGLATTRVSFTPMRPVNILTKIPTKFISQVPYSLHLEFQILFSSQYRTLDRKTSISSIDVCGQSVSNESPITPSYFFDDIISIALKPWPRESQVFLLPVDLRGLQRVQV